MSLPVTLPYTIGTMSGLVPASDLDANYNVLAAAINGINAGTNPLTNVSVMGGTWAGSAISMTYGGTGLTSTPTNGQLLIGNGSGYTLATLTAGSGISVTNSSGGISIALSGGSSGTVTSVAVSGGTTGLTTSGGPITSSGTITLAGTLAVANGGTGVTTSTGTGAVVLSTSPTLVAPILGTPTSGTLTNATGLPLTTGVTGTLAATNGGTGLTTYATGDIVYASATNTLSTLAAGANGYVLKLAGGVPTWQALSTSLVVGTSTVTGGSSGQILYDNSGVIGEKATTGSGNVVLATSPTLITPVLGTPTSVTLTNATGLPVGGISATGTPSVTTFLRGDGSWSAPAASGGLTIGTSTITGGTTGRILYDNSGVLGELSAIPTTSGGTNITSYATGDILYASGTDTLAKLTAGTNGYVLTLAAGVPTWASSTGGVTSFQTSLSGLTPATSTAGAITLAGTLGVSSGGTGQTTFTDGQLLIGNSTGNTLTKATLTAGSGITITNAAGAITITNSATFTYPGTGIVVSTGSAWGTSLTAPSGALVGTTGAQTLTDKRITPRIVVNNATSGTYTFNSNSYDEIAFTAIAGTLIISADGGTPTDGQKMLFRFDATSTQTLSFTSGTSGFRAVGVTVPASVQANKTLYVGCIYNDNTGVKAWDIIALAAQA